MLAQLAWMIAGDLFLHPDWNAVDPIDMALVAIDLAMKNSCLNYKQPFQDWVERWGGSWTVVRGKCVSCRMDTEI